MSASRPGNMRGPRVKTPLLLLLLLLTTLTGTVLCQDDYESTDVDGSDPADDDDTEQPELLPTNADTSLVSSPTPTEDIAEDQSDEYGSGTETSTENPSMIYFTTPPEEDEQNLGLIIIVVLVVLVVVIIGMIVCGIFISRRWGNKTRNQELRKEDPYLDGSNTEKVPMPMFEEDVPSVLELEMEELDQWMKKDSETTDDPNA